MQLITLQFKELSPEFLQEDPDHPRNLPKEDPETDSEKEDGEGKDSLSEASRHQDRLRASIEAVGILQPLEVMETEQKGIYTIIDGHRRYRQAKKLKIEKVPCCIYPNLPEGEFAYRQYEMQNIRKDWKPMERSQAFSRIKQLMKLSSDRKLAEFLGVSPATVSSALKLLELHSRYSGLMEQYRLPMTYRYEFVRMKQKIIKVGDFEINEIIHKLFEKAQRRVIRSAKDFRTLGKIFEEGKRHEKEVCKFLTDEDMKVGELVERTVDPPIVLYARKFMQEVGEKLGNKEKFTTDEKKICVEMQALLATFA
ncbi:MAG: ParB/RepB/Spo0J family partition protein [Patescibacteria group bacterium]